MQSIAYDIVVIPNEDLSRRTITASKSLKKFDTFFTLEDGKCFPHLSLYMLQLKVADLEKVQTALSDIAAHTKAIYMTARHYHEAEGYLDVEFNKNKYMDELKQLVITTFNPMRDGMREKDKTHMREATGLAYENFKQYGYKYVGTLARPHVTLTRFSQPPANSNAQLPKISEFDGSFSKIGLFEMGDHGTCVRTLAEFELHNGR